MKILGLAGFERCHIGHMRSNNKEIYTNVVHQSLIEKGYVQVRSTTWTYYLRDYFKRYYGLTWFYGSWWAPNGEIEARVLEVSAELDKVVEGEFTEEELRIFREVKKL
jgi:hypothetical protein